MMSDENSVDCAQAVTRRQVIAGLASAALLSTAHGAGRRSGSDATRRVDVHHHLAPPAQIAALGSAGVTMFSAMTGWSVQKSLDVMDLAGIHTSILSITNPGLWFDDPKAATLARACNEYSASLVGEHRGRFGFFAALPLYDVDASLREAAYALDVLGASGVHLFTNYRGKYLGDPSLVPLFAELGRRRAIVFVHPASAACCANLVPGVPDSVIEFGTETTRTIASLLFSEALAHTAGVKFIFSHAGGTMPAVIERFEDLARNERRASEGWVRAALARFYYDTAQAANRTNMTALKTIVPVSQFLFGSDYPFRDIAGQIVTLQKSGLTHTELNQVLAQNFARLSNAAIAE